ncbi:MAG TPA: hypothetical protein VJ781_06530 [Pyrinomonadaceae bacterium]|nr:hypothetical protein [Pyrinomonadaceae bacterium]
MKEFNWEFFEEGQPYGTANRVHVTIDGDSKIYFNKHAVAALGTPDGVSLMYDKRRHTIGVTATKHLQAETQGRPAIRRFYDLRKKLLQAVPDLPGRNPRLHHRQGKQ